MTTEIAWPYTNYWICVLNSAAVSIHWKAPNKIMLRTQDRSKCKTGTKLITFRLYYKVIIKVQFFVWETWELGYILREMNDRQALYSENDSEPQTGIRATHRSSEGCGFDPRLGLRIVSEYFFYSITSNCQPALVSDGDTGNFNFNWLFCTNDLNPKSS